MFTWWPDKLTRSSIILVHIEIVLHVAIDIAGLLSLIVRVLEIAVSDSLISAGRHRHKISHPQDPFPYMKARYVVNEIGCGRCTQG